MPRLEKVPEKELSPDAKKALAKFQVQITSEKYENVYENQWLDLGEAVIETLLFLVFRRF